MMYDRFSNFCYRALDFNLGKDTEYSEHCGITSTLSFLHGNEQNELKTAPLFDEFQPFFA